MAPSNKLPYKNADLRRTEPRLCAPLLTGEAQLDYNVLLLALAEEYPHLKEQMLGHWESSVCQAVAEFHH